MDHELHARIAHSWTDNADAWTRVVRMMEPVSADTGAPLSLLLQCERA